MMELSPKPTDMEHQELDMQKTQPSRDIVGNRYECKIFFYECKYCTMAFDHQRTYEKHVEICQNKLLNPVSFILTSEEQEPVFNGMSGLDRISRPDPLFKNNHDVRMEAQADNTQDDTLELKAGRFESNEFVVEDEETTDTHFSTANTDMNKIIEQLDNDLIDLDALNPNFAKPTIIANSGNTDDNIDLEIVAENDDHEIIVETFTDHSSKEENIKTLRVLSLPKNKPSNRSSEEDHSLHTVQQPPKNPTKKKSKSRAKFTRLRKLPPTPLQCINVKPVQQPAHESKPKLHVRTYAEKNSVAGRAKSNNNIIESGKKLYSVIERPREIVIQPEVTEMSVFEFVDEEDEKKKVRDAIIKQELKQVNERTCQHCGKLFDDPIDVLRHKREEHPTRKVRIPKEELKVYLELDSRPICPLCFKPIHLYKYRSIFTKHIMTHAAEPEFECKICGMKYKRKDHLENHEKRHVFGAS